MDTQGWQKLLLGKISSPNKAFRKISDQEVDEVLIWASRFYHATDPLSLGCIKKYGSRKDAQHAILSFLDSEFLETPLDYTKLFGHYPSGKITRKTLRKRYLLLSKIFHPDRGLTDDTWLTKRMEIINAAHSEVLKNPSKLIRKQQQTKPFEKTRSDDTRRGSSKKIKPKKENNFNNILLSFRVNYYELRKKLPKHLKLITILLVVSLVSIYLSIMFASFYLEDI